MKKILKKILPKTVVILGAKILKLIKYNNYNSTEYWKMRASEDGEKAVMWSNLRYNELYRKLQKNILIKYVEKTSEVVGFLILEPG